MLLELAWHVQTHDLDGVTCFVGTINSHWCWDVEEIEALCSAILRKKKKKLENKKDKLHPLSLFEKKTDNKPKDKTQWLIYYSMGQYL